METIDKINEMVKAGFPCYYIYTEDELSVKSQLEELSRSFSDQEYRFIEWTVNTGDLEDQIKDITSNNVAAFYILINIHFFLEQPGIIQHIKDGIPIWKGVGHKVFFLENDKKIPPEINRNITYIEFDLPDEKQLTKEVNFIIESALEAGLKISLDESQISLVSKSALGLTAQQSQDAFSLSVVRNRDISTDVVTEIKATEYLKTGLLELESPQSIDSFLGYDNLKEYIYDIKGSFFGESKFNLPPPKGILLIGPPGVGKSLASKAIASVFNLMLLKCDLGKVFGMYVGDSERNFRTLVNIAERMSPIVMRIDEIEKQLAGSGGDLDGGVSTKILGALLTWMQESTKPVFRVATANQVDSLKPELLRKGRFDEIFFLDLPSFEERRRILNHHILLRTKEYDFVNEISIESTEGWSGAELEQVVIQSLRKIEKSYVQDSSSFMLILDEEINKTVPLSIIRKDDIQKIQEWAVNNGARMASDNKVLQDQQENNKNSRKLLVN